MLLHLTYNSNSSQLSNSTKMYPMNINLVMIINSYISFHLNGYKDFVNITKCVGFARNFKINARVTMPDDVRHIMSHNFTWYLITYNLIKLHIYTTCQKLNVTKKFVRNYSNTITSYHIVLNKSQTKGILNHIIQSNYVIN